MTEAEWLTATDPTPMMEFVAVPASERKLRLLACGCCRRMWDRLILRKHEPSRRVVELVEAVADGRASELQLPDAFEKARRASGPFLVYHTAACYLTACPMIGNIATILAYATLASQDHAGEGVIQSLLIRDIFGNPFRPVALNPAWLSSTVLTLARGIYDDRAFDRMPILADALQDAGCENAYILDHCRGDGPHVRGCWAVDLILGKK